MQVFANSQPYSLPREVWSDYLTMINGNLEWDSLLDRYGVNLIVLDDERHSLLIHQLGRRVGPARFERRPTIFGRPFPKDDQPQFGGPASAKADWSHPTGLGRNGVRAAQGDLK